MPTTLLMEEFMTMLMEYMERRSKLDSEKFNEIVEQSKTETEMVKEANGWKIYLQATEEKGIEKGIEKGMALSKQEIEKANKKAEEANKRAEEERKKSVLAWIKNTAFEDAQIADILELPIAFIQTIRNEHEKTFKLPENTNGSTPQ